MWIPIGIIVLYLMAVGSKSIYTWIREKLAKKKEKTQNEEFEMKSLKKHAKLRKCKSLSNLEEENMEEEPQHSLKEQRALSQTFPDRFT